MDKVIPCMCQPKNLSFPNQLHNVGDPYCERRVLANWEITQSFKQATPGLLPGDNPKMIFKHPCGTFTGLKDTFSNEDYVLVNIHSEDDV
jgi:hypothetical protein